MSYRARSKGSYGSQIRKAKQVQAKRSDRAKHGTRALENDGFYVAEMLLLIGFAIILYAFVLQIGFVLLANTYIKWFDTMLILGYYLSACGLFALLFITVATIGLRKVITHDAPSV